MFLCLRSLFPQWIENGIPVRNTWDREHLDRIIPDDEGNAFVLWRGWNTLNTIFVTKIDTGGYRMWDTDSVLISTYPSQQRSFDAVPDGEGGFIIAWRDTRTDPGAGDIYAQRIDKAGNRLWGDSAKIVIREDHMQDNVIMCRLENNTYIITCTDDRKGLNQLLDDAKKLKFNIVLVWRFDRFARSTKFLIKTLEEFNNLGIAFISYQENIDLSTSMGKAMFTIISAFSELERDILIERTKLGLERARKQGKILGRPKITQNKINEIKKQRQKGLSYHKIAKKLNMSYGAVHKYINV